MYRILFLGALPSCAVFSGKQPAEGKVPEYTDTADTEDTSGSSDTDTDTSDTDTDTSDTNDSGENFCDQDLGSFPNQGPCWTQYISCGDTVQMSTNGGFAYFNQDLYGGREWYCNTSFDGEYSGAERVFLFYHPGDSVTATATLESPCGDLALVGVKWDVEGEGCPVEEKPPPQCEWSDKSGPREESFVMYENYESPWLVIVDSANEAYENFTLTIDCN